MNRRDLWLVGPAALALAPHALYVPLWVSLAVALALAWRLGPLWQPERTGERLVRLLLIGAGVLGTYLQFHTLAGPQAGISLLTLMVALKLLEAKSRRDHTVIVLAGYFLLMATLIHHQQLLMTAWLLASVLVLTASLVANQSGGGLPVAAALRLGGILTVQALPLAVLLFLLFPRLPSPMAGLVHAETARTGLSDSMSPGSVSRLIRSAEIAFRVDFADPRVDARGLYWRGPVLPEFDGRSWRRKPDSLASIRVEDLDNRQTYTITLEASHQPWLPVAGLVTRPPLAEARMTTDLEWLTTRPDHGRLRYTVDAWLDYRLEPELSEHRRRTALALPRDGNPETVALGRRWAAETGSKPEVVAKALAHFRAEPFHYTLAPPSLGEDAVDEFLFRTRRGFCEHYAGAFTLLMRAAGIPARVVTGYQGGERNPVGGYWIVRQRDAHAWAEVWLEGTGWQRVDPTAAVAPERVELGIDAALPAADRPLLDLPPEWLKPLRQAWDFLDNGWNQWVLGYDFDRQKRLLSRLSPSLASLKGMLWAMLAGAGLILAGLALFMFRAGRAAPASEIDRLYARFLRRLGKGGLVKGTAEGPSDFGRRAARRRPELADRILAFTRLYVDLRYGGADNTGVERLRDLLRGIKLGARPPGH